MTTEFTADMDCATPDDTRAIRATQMRGSRDHTGGMGDRRSLRVDRRGRSSLIGRIELVRAARIFSLQSRSCSILFSKGDAVIVTAGVSVTPLTLMLTKGMRSIRCRRDRPSTQPADWRRRHPPWASPSTAAAALARLRRATSTADCALSSIELQVPKENVLGSSVDGQSSPPQKTRGFLDN